MSDLQPLDDQAEDFSPEEIYGNPDELDTDVFGNCYSDADPGL